MPRSKNTKADVLAKLAASLTLPNEGEIQVIIRECHLLASILDYFDETEQTHVFSIFDVKEEATYCWVHPIWHFTH